MFLPYSATSFLQHHFSLIPGIGEGSINRCFGDAKLLHLLESLIQFSAWGHYASALLTVRRNGWNGDSLALKLCHCKEENLKFTDIRKTGANGPVTQCLGTCQGKEKAAFIRFPALPLLEAKVAACKIEMGCQPLHISTLLIPCMFLYS